MWRFSRTQTPRVLRPGRCIRFLFGEARGGWLSECDNPLARDQPARLSRENSQRLGLAPAILWGPAKNTDRRSTGKEKVASLPGKGSLDDAEDNSPKKPLSQVSLSSFCGAEVPGRLAKSFFEMIRKRDGSPWPAWLQMALRSPLVSFARRLQRDEKAVTEALRLPWSNGMVEGQIHRLKLIKRQMYGRAGFDLLRLRVLQRA